MAQESRNAGLIRGCALFAGLGRGAIAELTRIAVRRSFAAGELLFSEGDEAASLFILAGGEVDLVKISPEGREQFVRRVARGESFAEAAMFAGNAYPVTAIARSQSEALAIGKGRFVAFVKGHPDVAMKMVGTMSQYLMHFAGLLADVSLSPVSKRLASYLLARAREAGSDSFGLGISKRELAFRLGTIPETLSRNLRQLSEAGAIDVKGARIRIEDRRRLEEAAGDG